MQVSFEKSPKDYIQFFNAKGLNLKEGRKVLIGSIYSKYPVSVPIAPKTQSYLESSTDLNRVLGGQTKILENIEISGRDTLKSLWPVIWWRQGNIRRRPISSYWTG